jgi:hypothetical protein
MVEHAQMGLYSNLMLPAIEFNMFISYRNKQLLYGFRAGMLRELRKSSETRAEGE